MGCRRVLCIRGSGDQAVWVTCSGDNNRHSKGADDLNHRSIAEPIFTQTLHPPACHSATLVETTGGLYAVWYAGSYEGAKDTVLYQCRRPHGGAWETPTVLLDLPDMPVGNPVLYKYDGELWLFFVILYGEWWTEARIAAMTSDDDGRTWGPIRLLRDEMGLMTKTTPIVVGDHFIVPIYDERAWCSMVLLSRDRGETWELFGDTMGRGITIQPKIVELQDGRLLMYSRSRCGRVYETLSYNQGLSWISSQPTDIPNPNSGLELLKLASGNLLLVCNDTERGRGRLAVWLSEDEGKTWPYVRALEDSEGEFSYPFALETADGQIHVAYTSQRQTIMHAVIDEAWVKGSSA